MKAAVVTKPGTLEVRTLPEPMIGPYDAACSMLYGATCSGTDLHIIRGTFPFFDGSYPTVLGHESVGRVIAIGKKVRHFKIGDVITRVGLPKEYAVDLCVHWGGFCTMGIAKDHKAMQEDGIDAKKWHAYRVQQTVPDDIDPRCATLIITFRETLSWFLRMGFPKNGSVLIVGSGGNGLAFLQHAVNAGASHVAMIGSSRMESIAKKIGVHDYADYKDPDAFAKINDMHGEGFDRVIDAVGKKAHTMSLARSLKPSGTLGIYGIDEIRDISIKPLEVGKSFYFYNGGYDEAQTHEAVISLMQNGRLVASYLADLDDPYPLCRIREAFFAIEQKKHTKALIDLKETGRNING